LEKDKIYWIWLSSLRKVTPPVQAKLLKYFKTPEALWKASEKDLQSLIKPNTKAMEQLTSPQLKKDAYTTLEKVRKERIKVVTIKDDAYPELLKKIYAPPLTLYVKGKCPNWDNCIAVVGARKATPYGLHTAEKIAGELAAIGIKVVSGLARGIDTCAHRGAIRGKGETIAVLGCGPDIVYPPENSKMFDAILENGTIISEYPPGTKPLAMNFPARNRIISGISLGVVVIEAGEKSGSLITANFALDQGREVFAIPGNVDSIKSKGTNKLIKEGAKLVTGISDILEELKLYNSGSIDEMSGSMVNRLVLRSLDEREREIASALCEGPLDIESLCVKTGYDIKILNSLLLTMELKGVVEQMLGMYFRLAL
jgi:DNA processing protein